MVTSRIWFTAAQKAELWERWKKRAKCCGHLAGAGKEEQDRRRCRDWHRHSINRRPLAALDRPSRRRCRDWHRHSINRSRSRHSHFHLRDAAPTPCRARPRLQTRYEFAGRAAPALSR
jgi:hypothetical protein